MVATASSLLAGPPAPGRSASRSAFDRRGPIRVAPENAAFEQLAHRCFDRVGGTCTGRARPHRRNSHPGQRRFSGPTRNGRYSWARYYHPTLQRFISEDPLGFAGGDVNLYAYVANNPLLFIDPFGLDKEHTKCRSTQAATPVRFVGLQFSGLLGGLYGPDRRGFGKELTLGIAWERGQSNYRYFKSLAVADLEDPEGEVTGINLGIGLVGGRIAGNFNDFAGEAIEESFAYGPLQLTEINTSSGRSGRSVTIGPGLAGAATRLTTQTTFHGCVRR